jgi:hypothetical protein
MPRLRLCSCPSATRSTNQHASIALLFTLTQLSELQLYIMITKVFGRIAPALLFLVTVTPSLAGEVGVSNSWSTSVRHGKGQSWGEMKSTRQEDGTTTKSATKSEKGIALKFEGVPVSFGTYKAVSEASDSSKYSESTTTSFGESRDFDFTDTSSSHSVSAFAN